MPHTEDDKGYTGLSINCIQIPRLRRVACDTDRNERFSAGNDGRNGNTMNEIRQKEPGGEQIGASRVQRSSEYVSDVSIFNYIMRKSIGASNSENHEEHAFEYFLSCAKI